MTCRATSAARLDRGRPTATTLEPRLDLRPICKVEPSGKCPVQNGRDVQIRDSEPRTEQVFVCCEMSVQYRERSTQLCEVFRCLLFVLLHAHHAGTRKQCIQQRLFDFGHYPETPLRRMRFF